MSSKLNAIVATILTTLHTTTRIEPENVHQPVPSRMKLKQYHYRKEKKRGTTNKVWFLGRHAVLIHYFFALRVVVMITI